MQARVIDLDTIGNPVWVLRRGSTETVVYSLFFDPTQHFLLFNSSQDSLHIFDFYGDFDNFGANRTWKTKALSGLAYFFSGERRARFILDKPKNKDVAIIFHGEEFLLVAKNGDYFRRANFKKLLQEMAENSIERLQIDLQANLLMQENVLNSLEHH